MPAEAGLSQRKVLARAYRDYHRYSVSLKHGDVPLAQERDVLIAGKVAVVMPIDLARQEIVLIRQFRLAAHLANRRGDLIEFVAGRVESDESLFDAARRECQEEIGVAPKKLVELLTFLSTPGLTDEEVTMFLADIDAADVREGPLTTRDNEHVCIQRVSIDAALGALGRNAVRGVPMIVGLQWLALNRTRVAELLR